MAPECTAGAAPAPFSEKGFYLNEFRGRTLAFALPAAELRATAPFEVLLKELEANGIRALLLSTAPDALASLLATAAVPADGPRFEGAVWRGLRRAPRLGLLVPAAAHFAPACREIAVRLGVSKLVWIDSEGGLEAAAARHSFVDLALLRKLVASGPPGESPRRAALLREIEATLAGGVPAVNLCTLEGVADELFTYAGSGTLFTRERYVVVRGLVLDDFDAADDLMARGVAEGYLAPRTDEEVERVLASGFGAFVEGRYLAGMAALLGHEEAGAGEIASLYTLTRFLGEGVGGHLVGFALERARERGYGTVFACTTAQRVVRFFERQGFRRVGREVVPAGKWRGYDPERLARVVCLCRQTQR